MLVGHSQGCLRRRVQGLGFWGTGFRGLNLPETYFVVGSPKTHITIRTCNKGGYSSLKYPRSRDASIGLLVVNAIVCTWEQ